jgi:hypothetical protein
MSLHLPCMCPPSFIRVVNFLCFAGCFLGFAAPGSEEVLYSNNFEKAEAGKVPSDFLVLDGGFVVKEESGNKFLELPGAPLDSFAVQFGPTESTNTMLAARIKGTAKGRRYPSFGIGLNGIAGYKLQVSPAKQVLQILKDTELKTSIPYEWKSDTWIQLRLRVRRINQDAWKIEGKAWLEGATEPSDWTISYDEKEEPIAGRASVFGSPFSGTPIQFDDVIVSRATGP